MKKNILICMLLLVVMGGVVGQNANSSGRFEWVRGYAPGDLVNIIGSVTDSAGNLYILGSFNFASRWENGELLMPITPHGGAQDGGNILISKISPEGEMVWKKVIHGNYSISLPHDIKAVGDTAFACLVTMPLAMNYNFYLYYLDTLVEANWESWPNYPISSEGMDSRCLALITFDFDGNVLEQHFLQMSYLDRNGEDIYYIYPPGFGAEDFLSTWVPENPSFGIDGEGNIYLSRMVNDYTFGFSDVYRLKDGDISAVKFWCDRRLVGIVPADSTLLGSPQIIKFAPHFDTLLSSRHVFQSIDILITPYTHVDIDREDRIYLNCELYPSRLGSLSKGIVPIDSIQGLSFQIDADRNNWKSIIVRYDSVLTATRLISLEDNIIDSTKYLGMYCFNDIAFDNDSGLIVISCSPTRNTWGNPQYNYSFFTFDGIQTSLNINASVLILDKETMDLRAIGQLNSQYSSSIVQPFGPRGNLACEKNRIFFQSDFSGKIQYPDQILQTPSPSIYGFCLNVFDYGGNMIRGVDYHSYSPQHQTGPIQIHDSVLYLCSRLAADATFGDITVPSRGEYFACIAKYVDTSFMTPYVAPVPQGGGESINKVPPLECKVYPNPTFDKLTVKADGRIVQVTAFSMNGIQSELEINGNIVDISALQPGVYLLEVVTEKTKYYTKFIKL